MHLSHYFVREKVNGTPGIVRVSSRYSIQPSLWNAASSPRRFWLDRAFVSTLKFFIETRERPTPEPQGLRKCGVLDLFPRILKY